MHLTNLVSFVLIKKTQYELYVMFSRENKWGIRCDSWHRNCSVSLLQSGVYKNYYQPHLF